jgi:hypothetical protein
MKMNIKLGSIVTIFLILAFAGLEIVYGFPMRRSLKSVLKMNNASNKSWTREANSDVFSCQLA